jgi:hypothetical protein
MSTKLILIETEVRRFPRAASHRGLRDLVESYDTPGPNEAARLGSDIEEVGLAPAPIHCELPRRGHDPAVSIWGFGECSLAVFGHRVTAVSTLVGIDSCGSPQQRPGIDEALRNVGTTWTSREWKRVAPTVAGFWLVAQPGLDAQSNTLNLRLLTATRSREQFEAIEAATDGHGDPRWLRNIPNTPSIWGRVVFINGPDGVPDEIAPEMFQTLTLSVAGQSVSVRSHVALRRMSGSDATYVSLVVCGGPFEDPLADELAALLRRSLEHALANDWITSRAEQVNNRQAEYMAEFLDVAPNTARARDLRYQLDLLRYAFVDELEFAWSYEIDQQQGADELYASIDRANHLKHRWKRELSRFERLVSVAAAASPAAAPQTRDPIQLPDVIREFKKEQNPFQQIAMWWRFRGDGRSPEAEDPRHAVPTLQRPGSRRDEGVPPGAREIELHPFSNRPALFAELSASIALTSFMTAASAVFLGVILQTGQHSTLPMDVLFLFIATFGFLFATLIYANASGRLARHGTFGYESQVEIANRVSEYLGVFPLLIAIPLSVSRFLKTGSVPWAVAGLALMATLAYHYVRGASLLERDISDDRIGSDRQRKFIFVPALAVLMSVTFVGQLLHFDTLEVVGAAGFALLSLVMVLLSAMLPERTNPQEYLVDDWDALSEETPSFHLPDIGAPSGSGPGRPRL